jgi:crossover junction endodeoxyribonuclease RuvC
LKSPARKSNPDIANPITILGIDPGSIFCGYGVIRSDGRDACYIASGRIAPPAAKPLHIRLRSIHEALTEIISTYQPTDMVVEKIFFAKSAKAALHLGHARGVVLLTAAAGDVCLHECSALEVKKAIVGYGRAEKSQVQEMVKMILKIKGTLYPDSADALALALCYMNTLQFNYAVKSQNNLITGNS